MLSFICAFPLLSNLSARDIDPFPDDSDSDENPIKVESEDVETSLDEEDVDASLVAHLHRFHLDLNDFTLKLVDILRRRVIRPRIEHAVMGFDYRLSPSNQYLQFLVFLSSPSLKTMEIVIQDENKHIELGFYHRTFFSAFCCLPFIIQTAYNYLTARTYVI